MGRAAGGNGATSRYRLTTTGGAITIASQDAAGVTPYIQVTYKVPGSGGTTVTETTTLSGTNTDTLTIKCDSVKTQELDCVIDGSSIPTVPTSVTSDTAKFFSISQSNLEQSFVNLAIIDDETGSYSASSTNLYINDLTLTPSSTTSLRSFILYATQNIPVRITLEGGGGSPYGSSHSGGAGGRTVFDYTLLANTEYVFKLGVHSGNVRGGLAGYFYEKGSLLVVSGGGGNAGSGGNGGNGGGAGIQGKPGVGNGAGIGGSGLINGTLPGSGFLAAGAIGGRVESCTTGYYWAIQGKSPCEDLGKVNFRTASGTSVTNSTSDITRGFKADLSYSLGGNHGFRLNGGNSQFGNGGGGCGAIGGNATSNGVGGGGGGSGYTNGAVTVVDTGLAPQPSVGGAAFPARAIIELRT